MLVIRVHIANCVSRETNIAVTFLPHDMLAVCNVVRELLLGLARIFLATLTDMPVIRSYVRPER
jgi:hypothetical protein